MHIQILDRVLATALPFLAFYRPPVPDSAVSSAETSGRSLSGARLESLLSALHDDAEEAAREYEKVRRRLIRLFTWNGARFPEDLADQTLDHAAAALHRSGETIRAADKFRYCCSVAFTTLKEALRAEQREEEAVETHVEFFSSPAPAASWSERSRALETALEELDKAERRLILEYYAGSGGERIRHRRRMAALLGISPGALRLRTHKLRMRLEARVLELTNERNHEGN